MKKYEENASPLTEGNIAPIPPSCIGQQEVLYPPAHIENCAIKLAFSHLHGHTHECVHTYAYVNSKP